MKRTFLAIHIPSGTEYPALVESLKKNLPHEKYINYCRPDNIHLTLKFIGQTEDLDIPAINEARCIGCGACENLCPARPFSAIYVEGHEVHKEV